MVWPWQRGRADHRRRDTPGIGSAAGLSPSPISDPKFVAGLRPIASGPLGPEAARAAADITGTDVHGRGVEVNIGDFPGLLLLAFLHVHCDGCDEFWRGLRDETSLELPSATSVIAMTKGPGDIDPAEVEHASAGVSRVPVVMSDKAWIDYRVMGYPFFVVVDPSTRTIVAETVGFGWSEVISMVGSVG